MNEQPPSASFEKQARKLEKKALRLEKISHRIWEIDFLRGLCIFLMIWDHFMVVNFNFFADVWATSSQAGQEFLNFVNEYFQSPLRTNVQFLVIITFFSFCGVSCSFSKNNFKRGVIMAVCCFLITLVTYYMEIPIWFGALHLLTVGVLVWCAIYNISNKNKEIAGILCLFLGTILLGLDFLFSNSMIPVIRNDFLAIFGPYFAPSHFASADYLPILPYLGYVLIGCFGGVFFYKNKKTLLPQLDKNRWYRPVNFVGRHGLVIYVLHQVIITALLAFISFLFITPGDFVII